MAMVLHIITGLSNGGAERNLYNLIRNSTANQANTIIFSLTGDGAYSIKLREHGYIVISEDFSKATGVIKGLLRMVHLVVRFKPDVIMAWMYHACLLSTMFAENYKVIWNIRHSLEYYDKFLG